MRDMFIIFIITIFFFVFSMIKDFNNSALEYLVNFIPVFIPSLILWIRTPKNFLKLMSFKNTQISYEMQIRYNGCPLNEEGFLQIENKIQNLYNSQKGKFLNRNIGEYLFVSSIEFVGAVIRLNYDIQSEVLMINISNALKYRFFFRFTNKLNNQLINFFAMEGNCYNNSKINLNIHFFEEEEKENCRNPFFKYLFKGFNNKIVSFKYKTKNNSLFEIANHSIDIITDDLEKLNEDIKNELGRFLFIK